MVVIKNWLSCRISQETKKLLCWLSGLAEFLTFLQTFLTYASDSGQREIVKYLLSLRTISVNQVRSSVLQSS